MCVANEKFKISNTSGIITRLLCECSSDPQCGSAQPLRRNFGLAGQGDPDDAGRCVFYAIDANGDCIGGRADKAHRASSFVRSTKGGWVVLTSMAVPARLCRALA